ncbi:hypothetical protein SAMN05216526_1759 [Ectothiorhodosinus mongolicus]|uniref:Uncharacterized protein n=2 Tax=Ectothiorhodosinus mongolicus TaxID=233100 RepID=A0A1R3W6V2_9GAMM|nr:hypothetical protein SAMN05216526_1759 [Ectothiorhodosinus mongolicus]
MSLGFSCASSRWAAMVISATLMLFGGLIYITYRDHSLLMFRWFDVLGVDAWVAGLGDQILNLYSPPNAWFVYSLPNLLWLISGVLLFEAIWGRIASRQKVIWVSAFCMVAIGAELLQWVNIVPGTFDVHDLWPMVLVYLAYLAVVKWGQKL